MRTFATSFTCPSVSALSISVEWNASELTYRLENKPELHGTVAWIAWIAFSFHCLLWLCVCQSVCPLDGLVVQESANCDGLCCDGISVGGIQCLSLQTLHVCVRIRNSMALYCLVLYSWICIVSRKKECFVTFIYLQVFWATQGVYLAMNSTDENRGRRAGTFWSIYMTGAVGHGNGM